MENSDELQIEVPASMVPDLTEWGIEEVDAGVCLNTFENRRAIRENRATYMDVYTKKGEPTNYIQVITKEMREARLLTNKSSLLSDPQNVNSEYITGTELILSDEARMVAPMWVISATRHWEDVLDTRERGKPNFRPALASAPGRCRAKKSDGNRCANWHNGTTQVDSLCKIHLNRHSDEEFVPSILTKARNRLASATYGAVDGLEELALNATSEPVRLGAYKEILDRAGIRGGVEIDTNVNVNVQPAADTVKERLRILSEGQAIRAAIAERRESELTEEVAGEEEDGETEEIVYVPEVRENGK